MSYHYPDHVGKIVPIRTQHPNTERVADLVSRYPAVTKGEAKEILTFMSTGRHLDIGLFTSNDRLRPNLDAFMEDHKAHFRLKWQEGAAVVGGILVMLITAWLIWAALAEAVSALAETSSGQHPGHLNHSNRSMS
jgi:hypothetical protein